MRYVFAAIVLAGFVFLASPGAQASLLSVDPLALAAWRGTQTFYYADATYTLNVTADYAVYAPGMFPGPDPLGGTDYVYAYEIFNTLNPASVEVTMLTVGLAPNCGAHNAGSTSGPPGQLGGAMPGPGIGASKIGTTSARWFFFIDPVDYGEDSITLRFTSPYGPQWMTASVTDGGLSADAPMPSPMPEPATLVLLSAGLASTILVRRRRAAASLV